MKYRLLVFFYILSLVLILVWQQLYHLPFILVPLHTLVMAGVHTAALIAIAALASWGASRYVAALLVGLYLVKVLFFYLLLFGSTHFWGDIVTVKILGTYFKDFNGFLHSLPFSYNEAVLAIIAFIAIPLVACLLAARQIQDSLTDLWSAVLSRSRLLLIVLVLAIIASPLLLRAKRFAHLRGEPLMVMLWDHMWGLRDNPLFSQRRIYAGWVDAGVRSAYRYKSNVASGRNVVLIIVDALRADHLSAYGYERCTSPYLDSMIRSGHALRVDRCYSTCASTLCGVTSILLSREWEDCAVNGFNIIGLLHDQGYHTYTFISGAHKEWYNMAKFYSDDCTMYFDGKDSKKYYFKDDRVLLEGLGKVPPYQTTPSFFYFHLQSTHETGALQDRYAIYSPYKKSIATQGMNGHAAVNEYDNKVLQADDIIRQIMDMLAQKGYIKNSMVVITSDHGQGLGEHGVSGHVDWLYDPQTSVPLIFIDDSPAVYQNHTLANHIDIAPTIAGRLGLPQPSTWQGRSLLLPDTSRYTFHETGKDQLETGTAKYMIIYSPEDSTRHLYKYIYSLDPYREELYDVYSDPQEKNNLAPAAHSFIIDHFMPLVRPESEGIDHTGKIHNFGKNQNK
ncbi:MAG: sulfatase-like hydrolase/transferase [Bacteroidetes bacterium]|nr:sulfatase-like hydrolase/transferase [Bacteroidota bacterium]